MSPTSGHHVGIKPLASTGHARGKYQPLIVMLGINRLIKLDHRFYIETLLIIVHFFDSISLKNEVKPY